MSQCLGWGLSLGLYQGAKPETISPSNLLLLLCFKTSPFPLTLFSISHPLPIGCYCKMPCKHDEYRRLQNIQIYLKGSQWSEKQKHVQPPDL